jgi:elongation of very long chain fatty acids protein 7
MVHAFQLLFVECNYPKAFVWWIGMHAVMFFFLFKEFYVQSYEQRKVIFLHLKRDEKLLNERLVQ